MKVTFIIKGKTDAFFEGYGESIKGINNMPARERFDYLNKCCNQKIGVTMKIATGQFRDQVELNAMLRGPVSIEYKLEPRKGYKLATFEINKA